MTEYSIQSELRDCGDFKYYRKEIAKLVRSKRNRGIVVLHDALKYHKVYQKFAVLLLEKFDFDFVHFLDLPGHGLSGGTRFYLEDFGQLERMLKDYKTIHSKNIEMWVGEGFGASIILYLDIMNYEMISKSDKCLLINPFMSSLKNIPKFIDEQAFQMVKSIKIPKLIYSNSHDYDSLIGKNVTYSLWKVMNELASKITSYPYLIQNDIYLLLENKHPYINIDNIYKFFSYIPENRIEIKRLNKMVDLNSQDILQKICEDIENWIG